MFSLPFFILLSSAQSLIPPRIPAKQALHQNPQVLKISAKEQADPLNQYNEVGLTNDDALFRWINDEHLGLKKDGIDITAQKLTDNHENSLYSVILNFHNQEIEDRVVHFYQSRGSTTRFYTILGKNSNGLSLEEFNKFLLGSIGKCIGTACFEIATLEFLGSGGFNDLVHQLNSDGTLREVIATTGVISFLCSKAIEIAAGHGAKGLNPMYHLDTYRLLCPNRDPDRMTQYTSEPILDILNNRLDDAYHGYLKEAGLNPELRVSFNMRSKSDQNWIRELKKAIYAIYEKRYNLLVKHHDDECYIEDMAQQAEPTINVNIENISINIGNRKAPNKTVEFEIDTEIIDHIKAELAEKLNAELSDSGKPLDDSIVKDIVDKVIGDSLN